jgi:hypothetical protein
MRKTVAKKLRKGHARIIRIPGFPAMSYRELKKAYTRSSKRQRAELLAQI